MTEKAEGDGEHQNDRARDVRSVLSNRDMTSNDWNQNRERSGRQQYASAVDSDAAEPFLEVVAVRLENKPLIPEERKCDGKQIGKQTRENVSVSNKRSQQHRE